MDLPPGFDRYPAHDHTGDEQEEVYTVLAGRATLTVRGTDHELEPGVFARVGPEETRKITTEDEGARVLAIGGSPGKVYVAPEYTEEGQPDPIAS
jgi:quercetin dioxygenase-like cupin family protein